MRYPLFLNLTGQPVIVIGAGKVARRKIRSLLAAKAGALAAIVRSMTTRLDDFPHTGAMRYEDGVARIPTAAVSTTMEAMAMAPRLSVPALSPWTVARRNRGKLA